MKLKRTLIYALIAILFVPQTEISARKRTFEGTAIVAHRGFWNCEEAGYAKNSIAALKCAQEAGFWGSEFDVNMTADGELIVFHDSKVDGKLIEKHPYKDFQYFRLKNGEPIPTLDQYLEQAKKSPETVLVYELKPHSCPKVEDKFIDLSIERLKAHDMLDPSKVIFISFSKHICKRIAQLLPDFCVQYLNGELSPRDVKSAGINGIDYNHKLFKIHKKWVSDARKLDMSTNSWTVNKQEDMKIILDMKIDMITTDHPLVARDVLKEMKIKEL